MSEEVEKRVDTLTHEIPSNIPTQLFNLITSSVILTAKIVIIICMMKSLTNILT